MNLGELFLVPANTVGTLIVPPNIEGMITGVKMALLESSGRVSLLYTDGNIERATVEAAGLSFFGLVSAVQAKRVK